MSTCIVANVGEARLEHCNEGVESGVKIFRKQPSLAYHLDKLRCPITLIERPFPQRANCLECALERALARHDAVFVTAFPIVLMGKMKVLSRFLKSRNVEQRKSWLDCFGMNELTVNANDTPIDVLEANSMLPETHIEFLNGIVRSLFQTLVRPFISFILANRPINYPNVNSTMSRASSMEAWPNHSAQRSWWLPCGCSWNTPFSRAIAS